MIVEFYISKCLHIIWKLISAFYLFENHRNKFLQIHQTNHLNLTLNYINILQPVYLNIFLHVTFLQCSYFKDDERETIICEISSSFKNTFVEAIEKDVSVILTNSFIDN